MAAGRGPKSGFVRYQLPAIIWALLIFVSSSLPSRAFPSIDITGIDKVVHVIYYFFFCFFTYRALRHQNLVRFISRWSAVVSIILTMAYGASDEFHQLFVPGRSSDTMDLVADTLGGLLALLFIWIQGRMRGVNRTEPESGVGP